MKKVLAFVLAAFICLSMTLTAFAATHDHSVATVDSGTNSTTKGEITITSRAADNDYSLYKIFDIESYDVKTGAYVYTIEKTSPWKDFIENYTYNGLNVFTLQNYGETNLLLVSVNHTSTEETIAAFTAAAKEQIKNQPIDSNAMGRVGTGELSADEGITVTSTALVDENDEPKLGPNGLQYYDLKFSNLDIGYYLIGSTVGNNVVLVNTTEKVHITAKNLMPVVTKEVEALMNTNIWGKENTATIGQLVRFRVHIAADEGSTNYTLHDEMSQGLTYADTIEVYRNGVKANDVGVQVMPTDVNGTNYTIDLNPGGNDTFTIHFEDSFIQKVIEESDTMGNENNDIYIYYQAYLNPDALMAGYNETTDSHTNGNPNTAYLTYGDNNTKTNYSTTYSYTYDYDGIKVKGDHVTLLEGAKFKLYPSKTSTSEIRLVDVTPEGSDVNIYRLRTNDDAASVPDATIEAGKFTIKGLDLKEYYLEETEAPTGYNKLTTRVSFTPKLDVSKNHIVMDNATTYRATSGGIAIVNGTGSMLPETGSIGTTIFYVAGIILILGAVVFLIVRRKMSSEEE